jgi:UrcA family protein
MLGGVFSCALGAAAANAATADADAPSRVIHYGGTSLATDSGVRELYRRIETAARQVCPEDSIRDLQTHAKVEACRDQAVTQAIQRINNSRLAALHAASSKNS